MSKKYCPGCEAIWCIVATYPRRRIGLLYILSLWNFSFLNEYYFRIWKYFLMELLYSMVSTPKGGLTME